MGPPDFVTVSVLEDLLVYDIVVVTVIVIPVGKVVGETEPDPAVDGDSVLDHTDDLEGDTETEPLRLDVFDCVVDAVTVFVP